MALVTCKECGKNMSSEAKSCPSCGAPPPKTTSTATIVVGGFFAMIVASCVYNQATTVPAAPAQKSEAEKKEDAELNIAIAAGRVLKKGMKDPASFKVESFVYFPGGAACYEYRGKNSFGAVVPGKAVFDGGGKLLTSGDRDRKNFVALWNRICTAQGGKERAGGLNLLGVW